MGWARRERGRHLWLSPGHRPPPCRPVPQLVLSVAASLTHLAIAGAVAAMGAGRGPRPFVRLVLQCEELARAKLDSFFAALNFVSRGAAAAAASASAGRMRAPACRPCRRLARP